MTMGDSLTYSASSAVLRRPYAEEQEDTETEGGNDPYALMPQRSWAGHGSFKRGIVPARESPFAELYRTASTVTVLPTTNRPPLPVTASDIYRRYSSITTSREVSLPEPSTRRLPLVEPAFAPQAKAYLTPDVRRLIDVVIAMAQTKSQQYYIPIRSIIISPYRDPEEGWVELVIRVDVEALPRQALAFWDSLGDEIDRWTARLPEPLVDKLTKQLSIDINWYS